MSRNVKLNLVFGVFMSLVVDIPTILVKDYPAERAWLGAVFWVLIMILNALDNLRDYGVPSSDTYPKSLEKYIDQATDDLLNRLRKDDHAKSHN